MRPKRSASCASLEALEKIERRCAARIQYSVPRVGVVVFFNICGFNLAIFVNNMCLRFVLLTEANRLHWNLLSPVIEARCHTRCMSARMNDGKFSLILIYFLFGQLMQFLQFLNRLHTRSLFSTGQVILKRSLTVSVKLSLSYFAQK